MNILSTIITVIVVAAVIGVSLAFIVDKIRK